MTLECHHGGTGVSPRWDKMATAAQWPNSRRDYCDASRKNLKIMRLTLLFVATLVAIAACQPQKRTAVQWPEKDSAVVVPEPVVEEDTAEVRADTVSAKAKPSHPSRKISSSYDYDKYYDDEDVEALRRQEQKGGKYDRRKYHTDYSNDETSQKRRREYIDADGYDYSEDYDEYYGYGEYRR